MGQIAFEQADQVTGAFGRDVEQAEVVLVISDDVQTLIDPDETVGGAQMILSARMCRGIDV